MIYWSHVEQYFKNIKETYDEDEIIEFLRDCDMSDEQAHKFFDEFLKRKINLMNSFKDKAIGKLIDDFKIGRVAHIKRGNFSNKKVASKLIKIAKSLVAYVEISPNQLKDTNHLLQEANSYGTNFNINNLPQKWGFAKLDLHIYTMVDKDGKYVSDWDESSIYAKRDDKDGKYNITGIIVQKNGRTLAKIGETRTSRIWS